MFLMAGNFSQQFWHLEMNHVRNSQNCSADYTMCFETLKSPFKNMPNNFIIKKSLCWLAYFNCHLLLMRQNLQFDCSQVTAWYKLIVFRGTQQNLESYHVQQPGYSSKLVIWRNSKTWPILKRQSVEIVPEMTQIRKLASKEFYCCSPTIAYKDFKPVVITVLKDERKICLWQMKRGNFRGDTETIVKN